MRKLIIFLFVFFISYQAYTQDITNTLGTEGEFVIKDGSSTFFTLYQTNGHIKLPYSLGSTTGSIFKGTDRFLHTYAPSSSHGRNTFLGINAGNFTMSGTSGYSSYNTGIGYSSLSSNSTGGSNTAVGYLSLGSNSSGYQNTALGYNSLLRNTTGYKNTALGNDAGRLTNTGANNETSTYSLYLGSETRSGSNGNTNEIVIGYDARGLGSNSVVLGNSSITKTILRGSLGLGTESPVSSSILDLQSTEKGVLIPRMTESQKNAISSPATGLMIYQTDGIPGFYFYSGSGWTLLGGTGGAITGSGTDGYVTFWNGTNSVTGESNLYWDATNNRLGIGTTSPEAPLQINGRVYQTGLGNCTFFGYRAGRNDDGSINVNTAFGYESLEANTSGHNNSAIGYESLYSNTTGSYNTSLGTYSMLSRTTGDHNTAVGNVSLKDNTTGHCNTAVGSECLSSSTGSFNTALGFFSLNHFSCTGDSNTALGNNAGYYITSGFNNTCIGNNTQPSSGSVNNEITLGNQFVSSLRCNVTTITSLSDARDKKNIRDLSLGLDFITKLKPRQFNWDRREWYEDNTSDGSMMEEKLTAGFIAQEFDEVQQSEDAEWLDLVYKSNPEKLETTPGNLLPVMVKAIQELDEKNEFLEKENDELKEQNSKLEERVLKLEQMQNTLVNEIDKIKSKDDVVTEKNVYKDN